MTNGLIKDTFNVHFQIGDDLDMSDKEALRKRASESIEAWYVELLKYGGAPTSVRPKAGIITFEPDEKADGVSFGPVFMMAVSGEAWFPKETLPG